MSDKVVEIGAYVLAGGLLALFLALIGLAGWIQGA